MTFDRFVRFALAPMLAIGLLTATPARAALVFETVAGHPDDFGTYNSGLGIMTRFEVTDTVRLTSIAVEMDLRPASGGVKYLIFDAITGSVLFDSGAKNFLDDGMTFKPSDPFSFDLLPGRRYAIGAVANVFNDQSYVTPGGQSMGVITALPGNHLAFDFGMPQLTLAQGSSDFLLGFVNGRVRLYAEDESAVPVPATTPLLGLGLLALSGAAVRRRR
jgi:hypothetical protein